MRIGRAHHPHMELMRETDVANELSPSADQRPIFEPRQRAAENPARVCRRFGTHIDAPRNWAIAARTAATMFWYPVQRHRLDESTSRNSSSEIFGSRSKTPVASIRKPGVQ